MNLIVQVGRLTRDPELKTIGNAGTQLCQLDLATSEKWKDKNGETQEKTCFLRWKIWGKMGENAARYLKKGNLVALTGRLELETWEGNDGAKHSRHVGNCERMELMPNKKDANQPLPNAPEPAGGVDVSGEFPDDDIPF